MLVNDEDRQIEGVLTLALENSKGERISSQVEEFKIAPLGQNTTYSNFRFPSASGDFLLRAIVEYEERGAAVSTESRRHVKVTLPPGQGR